MKVKYKEDIIDLFGKPYSKLRELKESGDVDEKVRSFKQIDKQTWNSLSQVPLTLSFMRKYADKLRWDWVIDNIYLTNEFIKEFGKYFDRDCWNEVAYMENLDPSIMKEYFDKLDFDIVLQNSYVPPKILKRALKEEKTDLNYIMEHHKLTPKVVKLVKEGPDWSWYDVCKERDLPIETIRELKDEIHWFALIKHRKVSEEFIEEFSDYVDWDLVSEFQSLSIEFVLKHSDKIIVDKLLVNENVDLKALEAKGVIIMLKLA